MDLGQIRTNVALIMYGGKADDIQIRYYDRNIKTIAIDNMDLETPRSKLYKNPIICLDNRRIAIQSEKNNLNDHVYDVMFKVSDSDFLAFINKYELEGQIVSRSNVYNVYLQSLELAERQMVIGIIVITFLAIIQIALIMLVIKQEYRLNVIELSIKRLMGFSIIGRNKKIFMYNFVGYGCSILAVIFTASNFGLTRSQVLSSIVIIGGVSAVDFIITVFKLLSTEKKNIALLLKGMKL